MSFTTSHKVLDSQTNSVTAEIYVMNADGMGRVALTNNSEEERAPAWSPDGTRILYLCRKGSNGTFEICVMNADGTNQVRLTNNTVLDATGAWSPDGQQIVFHRRKLMTPPGELELFMINADGTGETQLTDTPGLNGFPKWRVTREPCHRDESN